MKLIRCLTVCAFTVWLALATTITVEAKSVPEQTVITIPDSRPMYGVERSEIEVDGLYVRATGYTGEQGYDGLTASGTQVRDGVLAGPRSWLGRECYLLTPDGEVLGEYVFEDTGVPKYVNEHRIDIWFEDNELLELWQQDVGDYVYIVWR